MSELPWLVVHGALVWKGALGALVLAGLAVAWARPRIAAQVAARRARMGLGEPDDGGRARRGAFATFAGRLQIDGEQRLLQTREAAFHIVGDLDVVAGSREVWRGGLAARRTLASGDRVRVAGMVGDDARDEAGTYRAAVTRRTLSDAIAAFEGAPRVEGPGALRLAGAALGGGMAFLVVFGLGGEIAMSEAMPGLLTRDIDPRAAPLGAILASATPFRRAAALEALVEGVRGSEEPDPAELDAREALYELAGAPGDIAAMWIAQGEPERGALIAERKGLFGLAARGWYAAADFEHASAAWERDDAPRDQAGLRFGVTVHLLAGHLDRAARASRALAIELARGDVVPPSAELAAWYASRGMVATCIADALDARTGDRSARRAIERARGPHVPRACVLLAADLRTGSDRLALLDVPDQGPESFAQRDVPAAWFDLLGAEVDPSRPSFTPPPFHAAAEAIAVPNGGALAQALPAVDRVVGEALAKDTGRYARAECLVLPGRSIGAMRSACTSGLYAPARAAASAAVLAFLAGEQDAARRLAQVADKAYGVVSAFDTEPARWRVDGYAAVMIAEDPSFADAILASRARHHPVDLPFGGAVIYAPHEAFLHGLRDFLVEHEAGPLLDALITTQPPDEDEKVAWYAAAGGDGRTLVDWLRRPHAQPGTFLRFGAPIAQSGRGLLERWVLWGSRPVQSAHPVEDVVHLTNLAEAARALGDEEHAAVLRERARRLREAILRRDTAVPLAVIERL